MIEGTIQSYNHGPLESTITVSFSGPQQSGPGIELLHRLGHKVTILTEDEYRELENEGTKLAYNDGYDEGYSEGYSEGRYNYNDPCEDCSCS